MKKKRSVTDRMVDEQRRHIGSELKRRRTIMKLTQEATAEQAGTNRKMIAAIELGKPVYSIDDLIRYCAVTGLPILPVGFDVVIAETLEPRKPFDLVR